MSIDPLIAFASSPLGKPSAAPSRVSKAPEKIFAGLLQTAETAALSAEESVRAATSMVHLARMQMLHGLFDFDDESAGKLLCLPPVDSRRVELPQVVKILTRLRHCDPLVRKANSPLNWPVVTKLSC